MKQIYKILLAFALSFGFLCASSQKASAQGMPTIDISNLVQNILGFLDDQMREGSFLDGLVGDVTKMQEIQERYHNMKEKLDNVVSVINVYNIGAATYNDILAVSRLMKMIVEDAERFETIYAYMNSCGFNYEYVASAKVIWRGFTNISTTVTKAAGKQLQDYGKMKQSDPLQLLQQIHQVVEDMYSTFYVIRDYFHNEVNQLYALQVNMEAQQHNADFLSMFFY